MKIATRLTTAVGVTVCGVRVAIDSAQDITVARRFVGPRKGFAVRLMQGGGIIYEWRQKSQADQEARYLEMMRDLAAGDGFAGVVATSDDAKTVTGEGLDWDRLEGAGG